MTAQTVPQGPRAAATEAQAPESLCFSAGAAATRSLRTAPREQPLPATTGDKPAQQGRPRTGQSKVSKKLSPGEAV